MLTHGDDYPIHQRPEPIATAGTDRNFYDRYFFNGYSPDGSLFFAAALGVYPHLNIIDAAFCLWDGKTQRSVFGSRILNHERMDTHAGPITVKVEHPLQRLRVTVAAHGDGASADLVFTGRAPPIEEPRFTRVSGSRTLMDVTRLTQNGEWTGTIVDGGKRIDVDGWRGTRDRSWGVRPIGAPDAQPVVPAVAPQFYWLWAPLNFDDYLLFFHINDDAHGRAWNSSARLVPLRGGAVIELEAPAAALDFKPGTRHAHHAVLTGQHPDGGEVRVELEVGGTFFMPGIGYGHPVRGHGMYQGPDVTSHESLDLAAAAEGTLPLNHIQALVLARMTLPGGAVHDGRGVLEQLIVGPHAPSGFTGLFDLAR